MSLGCLIGTPLFMLAAYDLPGAITFVLTRAPAAICVLITAYEVYETKRMVGADWHSKQEVAGAIICTLLLAFVMLAWAELLFRCSFA